MTEVELLDTKTDFSKLHKGPQLETKLVVLSESEMSTELLFSQQVREENTCWILNSYTTHRENYLLITG